MPIQDKNIKNGNFKCSMTKLTCPCCGNDVNSPHRYADGIAMSKK